MGLSTAHSLNSNVDKCMFFAFLYFLRLLSTKARLFIPPNIDLYSPLSIFSLIFLNISISSTFPYFPYCATSNYASERTKIRPEHGLEFSSIYFTETQTNCMENTRRNQNEWLQTTRPHRLGVSEIDQRTGLGLACSLQNHISLRIP